ncbi:putative colanic acid biosynthesis UDP-glucose lipid carrier transferase [Litorivivens lipolytica]|uniref:Putative colanic acid biosynthesis UDP-glucose lipid carrier transferase n=1 Tax=Litorivivens lipolytica TaxID=1524264 RepID=A0A7W4Z718_9GAMM|nr:undecaprenyl-phosphate glucose phosphotransferase [Litorivivens lipolytica]MBB3048812.1 putative colanic acid biosynthesis UDP-glucose lipid carrier transferase [Litorivivens lipolytica]
MLVAAHQLADVSLVWGLLATLIYVSPIDWTVPYQIAAFASSVLLHIVANKYGLYHSWRGQSLFTEAKTVFTAWIVVLGTLLTTAFLFSAGDHYDNIVVVSWAIAVPTAISFYRVSARILLRQFRLIGINTRTIAIVGAKEPGVSLARSVLNSPWMGLNIEGFYDDRVDTGTHPLQFKDDSEEAKALKVLGSTRELISQARAAAFDDIYIALPMKEEETIKALVDELTNSPCCVHIVPDIFTFNMLNARSREIGGLPVVSVYNSPFDSFDAFIKRAEDLILGSTILVAIVIPMLFIAAAVKLSSPGPVIFKQRRYGINGEEIEVWKFRSMTCCDNGDVVVQAQKNDERVTKVGAFLRKTSLDELPQFINVLQGTMSIVGPRPHAVAHNELYRDQITGYMQRHLVKPGITGWAQINGWRGETDNLYKMEKRLEFDIYYITNWSLGLDLKVIVLTLVKGFHNKGAY